VHKAAEGHRFYRDAEYGTALAAARNLGYPVLGAYFVLHPGTTADQVDFLLDTVEAATPWWRDEPWVWQIDAEKFDYMSRAPSISEINAFGDELCRRTGVPPSSVFAYAPRWLYGDQVAGLRYAIWASSYGTNPAGHYPDVYPGDGSSRWAAYGGKTPTILQYGSNTTIASQATSDANAYRSTLDQLLTLTSGGKMGLLTIPDDAKVVWLAQILPAGNPTRSPGTVLLATEAQAKANATALAALTAAVAAQGEVLKTIAMELAGLDPAKLQALTDALNALGDVHIPTADEIAAEVAAHEAAALRSAADTFDNPVG
jgi:hypothetical protein